MTKQVLADLNRLLADHLGRNPRGEATFKWAHSRDRELFYPLETSDGNYESAPQIHEDRWVLAKWMAPPSAWEWELTFKGQIPYPRGGYFFAVDTPCDWLLTSGKEPNERITNYLIALIKDQQTMTAKDAAEYFARAREHREKNTDRILTDYFDDKWTAFNHVPGRRGEGVSFGGI